MLDFFFFNFDHEKWHRLGSRKLHTLRTLLRLASKSHLIWFAPQASVVAHPTFATQKSLDRIQQAMEYREEKLKPRPAHREEQAAREGAATETARQINRLQFAQSLLRELARHENGVLEMQEEEKEGLEKLRKVQQNMRNCRTETTQYLHYL